MLDHLLCVSQLSDLTISNPNPSSEEVKTSLSHIKGLAQDPTALPQTMSRALLTQLNTAGQLITTSTALGPNPVADATQANIAVHLRTGMIQHKINTLGLGRALPEPHMKYLRVIAKQLGRGDLAMVKKTAEAALRVSRAGGDHFATGKWRALCEFLGSLDSAFFYDEMRAYLVQWADERPRNAVAALIRLLVEGDTPGAYGFAKEMQTAFGWAGMGKEEEMWRRVVSVLEAYREERLELEEEWFRLYQRFYRIVKEMAEGEGGASEGLM